MQLDKSEKISKDSPTPKYLHVVNLILEDIEKGKLKVGDRIPSINETSFDLLLSRDTVEKAYNELRDRGIISSVRGKGFYISSRKMEQKMRVVLLFNKLSCKRRRRRTATNQRVHTHTRTADHQASRCYRCVSFAGYQRFQPLRPCPPLRGNHPLLRSSRRHLRTRRTLDRSANPVLQRPPLGVPRGDGCAVDRWPACSMIGTTDQDADAARVVWV